MAHGAGGRGTERGRDGEREAARLNTPRGDPLSAKLFYTHSQVTFIPYGVVLKDERRTLNIERRTSNEKQISNTQHSTFDVGRSMFDVHF